MGRVIRKGSQYRKDDLLYKVTQILTPNLYEVRQIGNEWNVCQLTSNDFNHLITTGRIEFLDRGITGKALHFHDLSKIPEEDYKEAERRYLYVITSLDYTRYEQSKARMQKAIEDVAQQLSEVVTKKGEKRVNGHTGEPEQRRAPSIRSLYRWIKTFISSGQSVRSLVAEHRTKKNRKSSLDPRVDEIISNKIQDYYMRSRYASKKRLLDEIIISIDDFNKSIPSNKPEKILTFPHINTIYSRLKKMDNYELIKARHGKSYADYKHRVIGEGHDPTRPMEIVEMDHTILDLFLVDEKSGLPLGRPCITTMMDLYTRTLCGFHVGYDPPSYLAVMHCLFHALSSKEYVAKEYPEIKGDWLNHGMCEKMILDNGKDFTSKDLKHAAGSLGFTLSYSPNREPWHKGAVERFFNTINTGFLNNIPGSIARTAMSRFDQVKAGVDPQKDAIMSLSVFLELFHHWIIDVYHQDYHRGLGDKPIEAWKKATSEYSIIQVPSYHDLKITLGHTERRIIGNKGIEYEGLFYNCRDLVAIRDRAAGQKVTIKVNPADISMVHVHDDVLDAYLALPAVKKSYCQGLSLWQHKVILRRAKENKNSKEDELDLARARHEIEKIIKRCFRKANVTSRSKISRFQNIRMDIDLAAKSTAPDPAPDDYFKDEELLDAAGGTGVYQLDTGSESAILPDSGQTAADHVPAQDPSVGDNRDHEDPVADEELEVLESDFKLGT